MNSRELKARTKRFALDGLDVVDRLPKTTRGRIIGMQLGRSVTSVGANYRAACRARSTAEFISKIGTVIEEADESSYWLELAIEGGTLNGPEVTRLLQESDEILAIMTASRKTAESRINRQSAIGNRQSGSNDRKSGAT